LRPGTNSVRRGLGTSALETEVPGVAELKKGSRVTGSERDRLAADLRRKYDDGESIRALASATGRSYGFVHRILSESGRQLRGRGGATRGRAAAARKSA
jgi:hypothetical protein